MNIRIPAGIKMCDEALALLNIERIQFDGQWICRPILLWNDKCLLLFKLLSSLPPMSNTRSPEPPDYRESHLYRGSTYDHNLASDPFDAYMFDLERLYLSRMVPKLFPTGVPRYLDFACGTARITHTVAPFAKEAIGVDISPSMLEQARKRCSDVHFIEADLTQAKPDIGLFDLATAFRFFGNAQPILRIQVLEVLAGLVKPGGYLIINNHRNPHSLAALLHRATGGKREMDLSHFGLRRILAEHGFHLVDSRPIGAWMYRSRMLSQARHVDDELPRCERLFGQRLLAPIAPDTILITRRVG